MNLNELYDYLVKAVESRNEDYQVLSKKQTQTKFEFVNFGIDATIDVGKEAVTIKTESIFNVPPRHPASYAIDREFENRDLYTKILPKEGLVLFLSFSVNEDGDVLANGRGLGPYFEELISEMKGMIDAIRLVSIEKFPYLMGQNAIRVGDEVILVSESKKKIIQSIFSTIITKPRKHKFTSIFHEWIFGSTTFQDDRRLLPNFFIDRGSISFFAPVKKLIKSEKNSSKYEIIGTKRYDTNLFFVLIEDLLSRIEKLPPEEQEWYIPIQHNIKKFLEDRALIGTLEGEPYLIALNSDIRDFTHSLERRGKKSVITKDDVEKMAQWREMFGDAIVNSKFQERVMKARFAARHVGEAPKILGAESRKLGRSGGGYSVYLSPSEIQVCSLGKNVAVELVEQHDEKYIIVRKL